MSIEDESRRVDELLASGDISEEEAARAKARLLEERRQERAQAQAEAGERESARGAAGNTVPVDMRAAAPGPRRADALEPVAEMKVVSEHSDDLEWMREAVKDDPGKPPSKPPWGLIAGVLIVGLGAAFFLLQGEEEPAPKSPQEASAPAEEPAEKEAPREEVERPARVVEASAPPKEEAPSAAPGLPDEWLGKWVVDVVAMRALPEYARRHELEFAKDAARFSAMRFDFSADTVTQTLGRAPQRHSYTITEQSEGRAKLALTDPSGRETGVTITHAGGALTLVREKSARKMILIREGAPTSAPVSTAEEPTADGPAADEPAAEEPDPAADATHEVFNTAVDSEEPWLNMRRGPSARTVVTGRLGDGTKVKFLAGSRGSWWKVEVLSGDDAGKTGFVNSKWLKKR